MTKKQTVIQRTHPREIELQLVETSCANCGKTMEVWRLPGAFLPSTCTRECREEREKELNRIRQKRFRERRKTDIHVISEETVLE